MSTKHVNQLIKGDATLSADAAVQLDLATGVAATTWSTLEALYRSSLATSSARSRFSDWHTWLKNFNLPELKQRGIIPHDATDDSAVEALLRFFGISDPSGWARVWEPNIVSFRRTPAFTPNDSATTVWLRIGELKAAEIETEPFDPKQLRSLLPLIRKLTCDEPASALESLPELMATAGVAVVYAAEIDGCRASGATWWASPTKAVILLSDRGKREDRFWFSLFHEIGHVLLHAKRDLFLDQNRSDEAAEEPPWEQSPAVTALIDDGRRDSAFEKEADDFASATLIPEEIDRQIRSLRSKKDIIQLANDAGIAAGIVAGRWQFVRNDYSKFNGLRRELKTGESFSAAPPHLQSDS